MGKASQVNTETRDKVNDRRIPKGTWGSRQSKFQRSSTQWEGDGRAMQHWDAPPATSAWGHMQGLNVHFLPGNPAPPARYGQHLLPGPISADCPNQGSQRGRSHSDEDKECLPLPSRQAAPPCSNSYKRALNPCNPLDTNYSNLSTLDSELQLAHKELCLPRQFTLLHALS